MAIFYYKYYFLPLHIYVFDDVCSPITASRSYGRLSISNRTSRPASLNKPFNSDTFVECYFNINSGFIIGFLFQHYCFMVLTYWFQPLAYPTSIIYGCGCPINLIAFASAEKFFSWFCLYTSV